MGKIRKKKKKKPYRWFWFGIKLQIVLILLVVAAVGYYYLGGYAETIQDLHQDALEKVYSSDEEDFRNNETSLCYDASGDLISVLKGDKDVYYLDYEDIPSYVFSAFISTEDKKFYKHGGVDFKAIARAAWAAVRKGEITQGASTITQQLARNVYLNADVTWERKVEEIFIAIELEKIYSKDQILEYYVNNIYYGNGYYGIEAAAKGYFDTSVKKLSLSQIAFLCAIPNNPTLYDPLTNMDNTLKRRERVLKAMYEEGYISQTDYDLARAEEIELNRPEEIKKNDYVETYAYHCAIQALMEANGFELLYSFDSDEAEESYDQAYNTLYEEYQQKLYTEGYRIYTSIDIEMQEELQEALDDGLSEYTDVNDEGIYNLQGSATCIDNRTGYVVAIVGGRQQDTDGYTLNRAYQSFRQPGSSIKPLIVYTPAMERGYTPESVVTDQEIEDGPSNSDGTYMGDIDLRTAVKYSRNTIAWQLFDELTPEVGLSYLLEMNFSHIDEEDYRLPSSLGGFTEGVSTLEMASAYATLENDGRYRQPSCITKITDADGNLIWENTMEEHQIYKENASRMMTSILQDVLVDGTGKGLGLSNMPAAGKTGTTNENKDGWFVGYTYYYTTAVWVGYDMPQTLTSLQGASYPGQIWHDFMETVNADLTPIDFKDYVHSERSLSDEELTDDALKEEYQQEQSQNTENPEEGSQEDAESVQDQEAPTDQGESTPEEDQTGADENTQNPGDEAPNQ